MYTYTHLVLFSFHFYQPTFICGNTEIQPTHMLATGSSKCRCLCQWTTAIKGAEPTCSVQDCCFHLFTGRGEGKGGGVGVGRMKASLHVDQSIQPSVLLHISVLLWTPRCQSSALTTWTIVKKDRKATVTFMFSGSVNLQWVWQTSHLSTNQWFLQVMALGSCNSLLPVNFPLCYSINVWGHSSVLCLTRSSFIHDVFFRGKVMNYKAVFLIFLPPRMAWNDSFKSNSCELYIKTHMTLHDPAFRIIST